ncbi:MAG: hypothetical protein M5U35_13600 [Roseovarius sp.]|nr:hypothetical protein [Roseovarius sp.]
MAYDEFRHDDYNALSDADFRALVRRFLRENHPDDIRHPAKRLHWQDAKPWYMILSAAGWLAPALARGAWRHGPGRLQAAHLCRGI